MEVKTLQDIFIKILRSELNETELDSAIKDQLTPDVLSALFVLAKRHDLAHIVSSALGKCNLLADEEAKKKFSQEEIMSVYRYVQMEYAYEQICKIFDKAGIPYIPLKGSVIRPYYPKESMRTSCDIDILVKEESIDTAIDSLTQNGFVCGERNYHDVSLYSSNKVHLELHFNIKEDMKNLDSVLKDAWDYAIPVETSRYEFTKDFFVFHIFAHLSYHFLSGGCGIRPLMDIWIIKHKMGITYDCAKSLLEEAGIYNFAKEINQLVDICFLGVPTENFYDSLLSYIFNGGVYGTSENRITITKSKNTNAFTYALKRFFLNYDAMKFLYPVLNKCPILLPFCYIVRLFQMLFSGKTRKAVSELKTASNISNIELENIKQMRERLGLR